VDDDVDFDDLDPTYQVFRRRTPSFGIMLPVIVLVAIVAIVSGLVFGGVLEGSQVRSSGNAPTTQPTVQIAP
jgi:hypothetical protein